MSTPKPRQHAAKVSMFAIEYANKPTRDAQLKRLEQIQCEDTHLRHKKGKSVKKWYFNSCRGGETRDVFLVQGLNILNTFWGLGTAEGNKAYIIAALEMTDIEKLAEMKLGKKGEALVNYKMKNRAMGKIEKLLDSGLVFKKKKDKKRGYGTWPLVTFEQPFLSTDWVEVEAVPAVDISCVLY